MNLTRTEFLKVCAAGVVLTKLDAFAFATDSILARALKGRKKIMLETVRAADFAKHLDTKFRVFVDEGSPLDLILTEVDDHMQHPGLEQFTLILKGPRERWLPQGTYRIDHPVLGSLQLFMIPTISRDQEAYCYQVCFSRFAQ